MHHRFAFAALEVTIAKSPDAARSLCRISIAQSETEIGGTHTKLLNSGVYQIG
jgi:hypothetical protein